ncbi:alpha/beta hydrolase [Mycobacterium sp. M26]|uniref:alpha/beta fold hydrolase n=1 Tax=Mycobacterium sp. M26 TaxID=1762962 RepID=UPI00073F4B83|nr:alpha/beta hydrolase [Mycobacterium sp. M26]
MTRACLVHGVPETAAVWDLLVAELVALGVEQPLLLSPPGFGAPTPDNWGGTVDEYTTWLITELESVGGPVDLVGHDWGGGHVLNVAMTRPDLVRSWASDVVGVFAADYEWTGLAQQWQTPIVGEATIEAMLAQTADERVATFVAGGMNPGIAARVAPGLDAVMGDCILQLYRSAAQPKTSELGRRLDAAAARPGLALMPSEDHGVGTDEQRDQTAARAGARSQILEGLGHWWMTEDPRRAASILVAFWKSLA